MIWLLKPLLRVVTFQIILFPLVQLIISFLSSLICFNILLFQQGSPFYLVHFLVPISSATIFSPANINVFIFQMSSVFILFITLFTTAVFSRTFFRSTDLKFTGCSFSGTSNFFHNIANISHCSWFNSEVSISCCRFPTSVFPSITSCSSSLNLISITSSIPWQFSSFSLPLSLIFLRTSSSYTSDNQPLFFMQRACPASCCSDTSNNPISRRIFSILFRNPLLLARFLNNIPLQTCWVLYSILH